MPYITKKYPKMTGGGATYLANVDTRLYNMAMDLDACGWEIETRYPIILYENTQDPIPSFDGSNPDRYSVFAPAWSGYTGDILMVVDSTPPGYIPPPGYQIFITTGTTDGGTILDAVITAIQFMSDTVVNLGPDPGSSFPAGRNKLLMFSGPNWVDSGKSKLVGNPERFLTVDGILQGLRVSCNPNSVATLGGYVCRCAQNGDDPNNRTSVFLYRVVAGGSLTPHAPAVVFQREIGPQPVLGTLAGNESFRPADMTGTTLLDFSATDFLMACGPNHFAVAQISDGAVGHIEMAAMDLPVAESDITEASIGVAGTGGTESKFNIKPAAASNTSMLFWLNDDVANVEGTGPGTPRVMSLYPSELTNGASWLNGLGQISESWVGLNLDLTLPSALLGKFPGALVIFKGYPAYTGTPSILMPAFQFDNTLWVVFGNNVTFTANGALGTVAFRSDNGWETVVDPE